jgi:hypothetical protein
MTLRPDDRKTPILNPDLGMSDEAGMGVHGLTSKNATRNHAPPLSKPRLAQR